MKKVESLFFLVSFSSLILLLIFFLCFLFGFFHKQRFFQNNVFFSFPFVSKFELSWFRGQLKSVNFDKQLPFFSQKKIDWLFFLHLFDNSSQEKINKIFQTSVKQKKKKWHYDKKITVSLKTTISKQNCYIHIITKNYKLKIFTIIFSNLDKMN